jgi:hypothetical protein
MVKTVITGDEVEIKGFCGVDNLTVRQGLNLVDPNVDVVSSGSITTGSLVNTGSSTLKGDVSMEGNASVEGDMAVVGNNSVGGDLTVLGNLNAALAVHVVVDLQISRTMSTPQYYEPGWFTSLIQTKQALIDLTDVSGFKLLESGTYAIYFRYQLYAGGLGRTVFQLYQNGSEKYKIIDKPPGNDLSNSRIFFFQANADDIIGVKLLVTEGVSTVQAGTAASQLTQFGVIKLA